MRTGSFLLVVEGKAVRVITESSRLKFSGKIIIETNVILSDVEVITSGPINRGRIADLPLLRTVLAIYQSE